MLTSDLKLAIYMEANLDSDYGKMGFGVMRFSPNEVLCIVDSVHAGKTVNAVCDLPFDYPVVAGIDEAADLGAQVLVLGTAPSGGRVPEAWYPSLESALKRGMCLVNGLHDPLNDRFGHLLGKDQWIWDVRQPAFMPEIAQARAASLGNKRVLMIGTDMAIGKMTAGLEIHKWVRQNAPGTSSEFLATGQIGITITGKGIPLDAFKLDHACGAVETMVMNAADADIVFIEGQGSLLHPGSSATLSLMRGSCATHMILCHRSGMTHLRKPGHVALPALRDFIRLNEDVAAAVGSLTRARTIGIALNTSGLSEPEARLQIARLEQETGLPVEDVVRFGAAKLGSLLT